MTQKLVDFVKIGDLELSDPYPYNEKEPLQSYTATLRKGSMHAFVTAPGRESSGLASVFGAAAKGIQNTGFISGQDVIDVSLSQEKQGCVVAIVKLRNFVEKWTVEAQVRLDADNTKKLAEQLRRFFRLDLPAPKK